MKRLPTLPHNKWTVLALCWFIAGAYALVWRENADTMPPPIRHFDKIGHFFLFFAQFRLAAQAYIAANIKPPYVALMLCALIYAAASEAAQHFFTATRQADIWDAAADLLGAAAALCLAKFRFGLNKRS